MTLGNDAKNSFYQFIDILYKLIVLNVFTLLGILVGGVILGIVPGFVALITCLKDLKEGKTFPLFKGYFERYFKTFKKTIGFSLINLVILAGQFVLVVLLFNAQNEENSNPAYQAFYLICLFFSFIIFIIMANQCMVLSYFPELKFLQSIQRNFYLLVKRFWKTLVMIILMLIFIYFILKFPYAILIVYIAFYFYLYNRFVYQDYCKLFNQEKLKEVNNEK